MEVRARTTTALREANREACLAHWALFAAILVILLLGGCATRPKINPNIDWNSRIGSYTYEQTLAELGKPDVIAESSDGRTMDWIIKRSPNMSFGFGVGNALYGPHVGTGVGVGTTVAPPPHGEYLRLIFDQQNRLKAWTHQRY
jgi:hypothetical protein